MICKRTDTDPPVNRSTHSLADFGDFHRLELYGTRRLRTTSKRISSRTENQKLTTENFLNKEFFFLLFPRFVAASASAA